MRGLTFVEGDSVAQGTRMGVLEEETWAYLFGRSRGVELRNIARQQSTVGTSLSRLPQVLETHPAWYIAQFGEWSLFRPRGEEPTEPLGEFKHNMSSLLETLLSHKISVCLVTPPPQLYHWGFAKDIRGYLAATRELAALHKVSLLDAHSYMAEDVVYNSWKEVDSWFDVQIRDPIHYSSAGHKRVAAYFDLPEYRHIGT